MIGCQLLSHFRPTNAESQAERHHSTPSIITLLLSMSGGGLDHSSQGRGAVSDTSHGALPGTLCMIADLRDADNAVSPP